ncbi:MAG: cysteine--tRNA ligase [archaeon]|jgi:cysteinyl-tRNA synthetase
MSIKIYNTATKKKESFKSITPNHLKIYVCGVTIYDDVHLGHAFSYIYYDILINYFKYFLDSDILYVRNITDVGHLTDDGLTDSGEDKIEKRATERKMHPMELVYKYSHRMWKYFDDLKLSRPNLEPTASAHIPEMQEWIKKLLANGFAYEVNGNVYYDISKFKDYGKFANRNIEELEKNTRFENDPQKKNSGDFALWIKAKPEHILKWPSPWGEGYPGWHLECSVMGTKYLGEKFDMHGGGIEHLFPHHQNEIAQNYGYFGKDVVNYWVHTALLMVDGKKMGKSLGNFITIENFLKNHSAESLRYLFSTGHYRKPQNYTEKAIEDSEIAIDRLNKYIKRLQQVAIEKDTHYGKEIIDNTIENFKNAMNDDLNTPSAWANIWFLVKETNRLMDLNQLSKEEANVILDFLQKVNLVFKIFNFEETVPKGKQKIQKPEIEEQINKRNEFRKLKKWEEADNVRLTLEKKGVILSDSTTGTTWHYE